MIMSTSEQALCFGSPLDDTHQYWTIDNVANVFIAEGGGEVAKYNTVNGIRRIKA